MTEHLKMQTPDSTDQNIEKIAELFPSAVTEMRGEDGNVKKGINFETLKQLLSHDIVDGSEHYEFTWVGKKQAMAEAARSTTQTLRPVPADSKNWDTTENLYIEGDNLEVLKILQQSYLGKVKMIYIDPPYNTGSDSFTYPDNYSMDAEEYAEKAGTLDENGNQLFKENNRSNPRFHSDWCSMMYERMMLARNLLSEDGILFVSIDENEVDNLTKIGKEIFGEDNYINALKWKRKKQPSFLSKHIAPLMEYVLILAKCKDAMPKLSIEKLSDTTKKVINISNPESVRRFDEGVEVKGVTKGIIPRGTYTIKTMEVTYLDDVVVEEGRTKYPVQVKAKFLNTQDKIDEFVRERLLFITAAKGLRRYVSGEESEKEKSITDLLLDWGDNQDSEKEQKEIFKNKYFDYTKPLKLMRNLIKAGTDDDSIILDFFSGSATTAHAVMQLNAEDGGHRKFIMVQLPEPCDEKSEAYKAGYKNICEIGKERIRRAGDKIKAEHPEAEVDTGFRVFRVDSSNMKDVYFHPEEVTQTMLGETVSNIKPDRTDLDLLYDCMLRCGVEINLPHTTTVVDDCKVHNVDNGALMACFDEDVSENVIRAMAAEQPIQAIFRDSSFANDADKINVAEIFKNLSPDTKVRVI